MIWRFTLLIVHNGKLNWIVPEGQTQVQVIAMVPSLSNVFVTVAVVLNNN